MHSNLATPASYLRLHRLRDLAETRGTFESTRRGGDSGGNESRGIDRVDEGNVDQIFRGIGQSAGRRATSPGGRHSRSDATWATPRSSGVSLSAVALVATLKPLGSSSKLTAVGSVADSISPAPVHLNSDVRRFPSARAGPMPAEARRVALERGARDAALSTPGSPARHVKWESPAFATITVKPPTLEGKALADSLAWARLGLGPHSTTDCRLEAVPVVASSVVLVTLWRDPVVSRVIACGSAGNFLAFAWAARAAFSEVIRKNMSFFFVGAGGLWEDKLRIDSDDKLACVVNVFRAASPLTADLPSLFLYDDAVSPDSPPGHPIESLSAATAAVQARPPSGSKVAALEPPAIILYDQRLHSTAFEFVFSGEMAHGVCSAASLTSALLLRILLRITSMRMLRSSSASGLSKRSIRRMVSRFAMSATMSSMRTSSTLTLLGALLLRGLCRPLLDSASSGSLCTVRRYGSRRRCTRIPGRPQLSLSTGRCSSTLTARREDLTWSSAPAFARCATCIALRPPVG